MAPGAGVDESKKYLGLFKRNVRIHMSLNPQLVQKNFMHPSFFSPDVWDGKVMKGHTGRFVMTSLGIMLGNYPARERRSRHHGRQRLFHQSVRTYEAGQMGWWQVHGRYCLYRLGQFFGKDHGSAHALILPLIPMPMALLPSPPNGARRSDLPMVRNRHGKHGSRTHSPLPAKEPI